MVTRPCDSNPRLPDAHKWIEYVIHETSNSTLFSGKRGRSSKHPVEVEHSFRSLFWIPHIFIKVRPQFRQGTSVQLNESVTRALSRFYAELLHKFACYCLLRCGVLTSSIKSLHMIQ